MAETEGTTFASFAQNVRTKTRAGSLDPDEAQHLLSELSERAAEMPAEAVQRLLLQISAFLTAVAARRPSSRDGDPEASKDASDSDDRLLTVEEAAKRLNVTRRWLYANHHKLPFTRRLSRKALRFSEKGLERWLKHGRPASNPRAWGN